MRSSTACLILFAAGCAGPSALSAPAPAERAALYAVLDECARVPALRAAACQIVADDLHPDGRAIAEAHRLDPDPSIRKSCYVWLLTVDRRADVDWLAEGLADPDVGVRTLCLTRADRVAVFSDAARDAVRGILAGCRLGHVFEIAARALVERDGPAGAREVFELVRERDPGWWPYAVGALAIHPEVAFRELFETVGMADGDAALVARRALATLDGDTSRAEGLGLTAREFHERWQHDAVAREEPEMVERFELLRDLTTRRVVILGELHAWMPARAEQIAILAELHAVHGDALVLICERPVVEYQRPLMDAAGQFGIECAFLESEELAMTGTPHERDEIVRRALVETVAARPDEVFLVCYGNNHLQRLRAAVEDAGIEAAAVALDGRRGMLGAALRRSGSRLEGHAFRFDDGVWFLPVGSLGMLLGSRGLAEALRSRRVGG